MSSELLNAEQPTNYIYSVRWTGLENGTEVTLGDQTLVIGVNAFSNAYDAITQACADYDVVWDDIDWYDEENLPAWKVSTADIYCDTDIAEDDYEAGELVEYDAVNPNNPDEIYGCGIRLTYGTDLLNDFVTAETQAGEGGAVVLCGGTYTITATRYNTFGTSVAVTNGAVIDGNSLTLGSSGDSSSYDGTVAVIDGGTIASTIALGGRGPNTGNTYLYMSNGSYASVINMDGESSGNGSETAVDENGKNLYTNYAYIKDSGFGVLRLARGGVNYQNADITIENSTGNNLYWTGDAEALEMMGDVNITLINANITGTLRDESSRGVDSDYDGTMNIYVKGGTSTVATLNLEDSKTTAAGRTITIDANSALIAATCAFTGNIVIDVADFELDGDSKFVMSGSNLSGANISIINDVQSQYAYQLSDDGKTISLTYRPVYATVLWGGLANGTVVSAAGLDDLVIGKGAFSNYADAVATGKPVEVLDVVLNNELVADGEGNATVDGYTAALNGGVIYNTWASAVSAYAAGPKDGVIYISGGTYSDASGSANTQTQVLNGHKTVAKDATFTFVFAGSKGSNLYDDVQADVTLIGSTVTTGLYGNRYVYDNTRKVIYNITEGSYVVLAQASGMSGAGSAEVTVSDSKVNTLVAGPILGSGGAVYNLTNSTFQNVGLTTIANGSASGSSTLEELIQYAGANHGDAVVNISGSTVTGKLFLTRGLGTDGSIKLGVVLGDAYLNVTGNGTTYINTLYANKYYSKSVNITVAATATLQIDSYYADLSADTNFTVTTDGLALSGIAAKKVITKGGDQFKALTNYTFTGENSDQYVSFWDGNVLAVSLKALSIDAADETIVVAAGDIVYSGITITVNTDGVAAGTEKLLIDSADNNLALTNVALSGANAGAFATTIVNGDLYLVAKSAYVSALYSGLEDGTVVVVSGGTAIIGENAFADYDTAAATGLKVEVIDSYLNTGWVEGEKADVVIGSSTVSSLVGGSAAVDGVYAYNSAAGAAADHTAGGNNGILVYTGGTLGSASYGVNLTASKYYDVDGSYDQSGIVVENANENTTGILGANVAVEDVNIKVVNSTLNMVRGASGDFVTGTISIDITGSTITGSNTSNRYYSVNGLGATTSASRVNNGTTSFDFKFTDSVIGSVAFGGYGSGSYNTVTSGYGKVTMVNSTVTGSIIDHWNTTSGYNNYGGGQFFDLTNSSVGGRITVKNSGKSYVTLKDASSIYDLLINADCGAVSVTVTGTGESSFKTSVELRANDTLTIDAATASLTAGGTFTVDCAININVDGIQWAEGAISRLALAAGTLAGNYTINLVGEDASRYTYSVVNSDIYINRSFAVYSKLWEGLAEGTVVTFSGGTAIIGENAFADYASALAAGAEVINTIDAYVNSDWTEGSAQTIVIDGRTVTTTVGGASAADGVYAYNDPAGADAALTAGGNFGLLRVVGGTYSDVTAKSYTSYAGTTSRGLDMSDAYATTVTGGSGNVDIRLSGSTIGNTLRGSGSVSNGTIKIELVDSAVLYGGNGDSAGLNGLGATTGGSTSASEIDLSIDIDLINSYSSQIAVFGRGSGGTAGINTTGTVDVALTGSTVGSVVLCKWGIKAAAYDIQGGLTYTVDNSVVTGSLDVSHNSDIVIDIKNGSSVGTISRLSYVDETSDATLDINITDSTMRNLNIAKFVGKSVDIDISGSTVSQFTASQNAYTLTGDYNCTISNTAILDTAAYFRLVGASNIAGNLNVDVNTVTSQFKGFYLNDGETTVGGNFNVSLANMTLNEGIAPGDVLFIGGDYNMTLDGVTCSNSSVRLLTETSTVGGNVTVNVRDLSATYILIGSGNTDVSANVTGAINVNFVGGTTNLNAIDGESVYTATIAADAVLNYRTKLTGNMTVVNNGTINIISDSMVSDYNTYGYTTVATNITNNGTITVEGITEAALATDSQGNTFIYALNQREVYVASDITGNLYDEIHYNGHWLRIGINAFTSIEDAKTFVGENDTTINVSSNAIDADTNFYGDGAKVEISEGTFTKGLIGGQEVVADTVIDTDSSIEITGDVSAKAVYGGQYVSGGTATVSGDTAATVSGGVFSSLVAGGSVVKTGATAVMSGESTLTITGGAFANSVAGGSTSQGGTVGSSHDYVANLNISGGTFGKSVYGGNIATKAAYSAFGSTATGDSKTTLIDIAGSTNVNIDASSNSIVFADGAHIIAGSHGSGQIMGDTTVTFKGLADNLDFTGFIVGDSQNAGTGDGESCVTGTRSLIFDNFDGELDATRIVGFDSIAFENGSEMSFANKIWLENVSSWNFSDGSSLVWTDGANNFAGDTINISMSDGFELGEDGWTLITGTEQQLGSLLVQGMVGNITINGVSATANIDLLSDKVNTWTAGEYQLTVDETNWTLKVSAIA